MFRFAFAAVLAILVPLAPSAWDADWTFEKRLLTGPAGRPVDGCVAMTAQGRRGTMLLTLGRGYADLAVGLAGLTFAPGEVVDPVIVRVGQREYRFRGRAHAASGRNGGRTHLLSLAGGAELEVFAFELRYGPTLAIVLPGAAETTLSLSGANRAIIRAFDCRAGLG
ncbi:MAG: hypothetical protein ACK4WC_02050 [Rubrimonas sp.]